MGETHMKSSGGKQVVEEEYDDDDEAFMFAMQLVGASAVPMVLKSALELGILETIAKAGKGEYLSTHEIVSKIPITINNPEAPALLDRLLRLLASFHILLITCTCDADDKERKYGLAPLAKYFVNNDDGVSMVAPFLMQHDKLLKDMWYHLTDSIREGGLPFDNCYGMTSFEFHRKNQRSNEMFNKAMRDHSSIIMQKVLERYKLGFEGVGCVVDVGGGTGAVISMIVSKYPNIKAINFDLPHVIQDAPSYPGVEHVAGDMFVSVPRGDAIFMKWICHDWNDKQCVKFLKNCYDSVPDETGKVILVECIVPEEPESSNRAKCVFQMDAIIMCHSSGGRERTQKQYEALAKAAGFQGFRVACSAFNMHVMEFLKKP